MTDDRSDQAFGHPVEVRVTLVSMTELVPAAAHAGLVADWQESRGPYPAEHPTPRLYLWARRPA